MNNGSDSASLPRCGLVQANELNKNGELYVIRKPDLRTKIVDGTSLAAAAVLHMIPRGTADVLLLGDAGGKMAAVLASALCERQIQVRTCCCWHHYTNDVGLSCCRICL